MLNDLVQIFPKEVILVCGSPNAGKTLFALNVALLNKDIYPIKENGDKPIYHFVSEMGPAAFNDMLTRVSPSIMVDEYDERIEVLVYKPNSIQDQIHPHAINIVDYLEPKNDDYREIVPTINAIYRKLQSGVAVVCVQQPIGRDPRGGVSVFEKPRLAIALMIDKQRHCCMAEIIKGKNNKTGRSSIHGLELDYRVDRRGTLIRPLMDSWKFRDPRERKAYNTDF